MTVRHRLAAIWFADLVDYSRLSATDQAGAMRLVALFQDAGRAAVQAYGGRVVKFLGDGALAEFPSIQGAIGAADALQRAMEERLGEDPAPLRIGIHCGEVVEGEDGDVYGDGVNVAQRIQSAAAPGEILVSGDACRQARQHAEIGFEPLGERELKGIGKVELHRVRLAAPIPPESPGRPPRWGADGFADRLGRRRAQVGAGVAILAAVAVGWMALGGGGNGGEGVVRAALDPARLAVLYFDDRSADGDLDHLAAGFTESIIDQLSGLDGLEVLSRHAVEPFRGASVPHDSLAGVLGAGTIVDGSVERVGDRLRVRIQLIDAGGMSEIAAWTEEREMEDILSLQSDLAADVASALRDRLGARLRLRERREGTRSVEAWELVRQAEALGYQARKAQDDVSLSLRSQADSLLARAEALDPAWSEPTLLRAELAAWMDETAYARGLEHADRVLRMEPGSAAALRVRGVLHDSLASVAPDSLTAARELGLAQRDLRMAVAADPTSAPAWIALSNLLYNDTWELGEAREAAREAYDNDAFLLEVDHFVWLCEISLQLADYAEARRWCGEGLRRNPGVVRLLLVDLYVLASPGVAPDPQAAWRRVEEIGRQEFPEYNVPPAEILAAAVLARGGAPDSARAVVTRARRQVPPEWAPYLDYFEAYVRLILEEPDEAVALLGTFLAAAPEYRAVVARDVWFEELSGDPAFERIVDRARLPLFCRILCEPPPDP